jgi:ATP-dependent helicase HrpA
VARGKDLAVLQERLAAPARRAIAEAVAGELERTGLRAWPDDVDELPRVVERTVGGRAVRGFPAFVDSGSAVDLRVFATSAERDRAMGPGTRRLMRLGVASPIKAVERQLDPRTRLALAANPDGSLSALLDDCADAAVDVLVPGPACTRAEFVALRDRVAEALAR